MNKASIIRKLRRDAKVIDAHTHVGIDPVQYARGDYPYGISGEDMALRLDAQGIDAAVCYPFVYSSYFQFGPFCRGRFVRDSRGTSTFPYEAENTNLCCEIYEAFPELAGKLLPFAFFDPARRPVEQAAFLGNLTAQYPIFGLKTVTSYIQSRPDSMLKRGACILDLAAELSLPLTLHTAVHPDDPWGDVSELLKVVSARPDVRFNLAHTCRFDRRALDAAAELDNCWVDLSAFHIHCKLVAMQNPAVAPKSHRFPADYRRHAAAMQKIVEAYPGMILWGTDTPYHVFKSRFYDEHDNVQRIDLDCSPLTEITEFRKLPKPLQKRIAFTNTLRWLADEE